MELVLDLNSLLFASQQTTNSNNYIENSPNIRDISTGCKENAKTIQELNDDCLLHIFKYIPRGDLFVLEKVCRRWKAVCRRTWRTFKKFDLGEKTWGNNNTFKNLKFMNIVTLEKILYRCGSFLTHIDFSNGYWNFEELSQKVIPVFTKYCRNLQYINMENWNERKTDNPSHEKELSKLFLINKKIRYVSFANTNITGKCLFNLPAESLETLIMTLAHNISPCYLQTAVKKLQKLRTLKLLCCDTLTCETFNRVCFYAKSLKEFQFGECRRWKWDNTLLHIEKFINLEILDIRYNDSINNAALKVIGEKCKELRRLNISDNYKITDEGLINIVSLPKLQYLDISSNDKITDEIFNDIYIDMPNLRKLKCTYNQQMKSRGLCRLIKKSPNLEILNVSGCVKVNNELVEVAIKATKNRTNNVTLHMYVSNTGINIDHFTTAESPFLQLSR